MDKTNKICIYIASLSLLSSIILGVVVYQQHKYIENMRDEIVYNIESRSESNLSEMKRNISNLDSQIDSLDDRVNHLEAAQLDLSADQADLSYRMSSAELDSSMGYSLWR